MLSNNPRQDLYKTILPETLFLEEITRKYNDFLKKLNGTFKTIDSVVNESITSIDIPGFEYNAVTQTQLFDKQPGEAYFKPNLPVPMIMTDKSIVLRLRFSDYYINYVFMLETYFAMYKSAMSKVYKSHVIPVYLKGIDGTHVYTILFTNCQFNGITGVNLSHNNMARDFKEFELKFQFEDFSISFELPN